MIPNTFSNKQQILFFIIQKWNHYAFNLNGCENNTKIQHQLVGTYLTINLKKEVIEYTIIQLCPFWFFKCANTLFLYNKYIGTYNVYIYFSKVVCARIRYDVNLLSLRRLSDRRKCKCSLFLWCMSWHMNDVMCRIIGIAKLYFFG